MKTQEIIKLQDADCMDYNTLDGLDVDTLRDIYRRYRRSACYLLHAEYVNKKVREIQADYADTPAGWVMSIRLVAGDCERCRGTGIYSWGACINGRMTHSGSCARCAGKGIVTNEDCRRAYAYDQHAIRRAFSF